MSETKGVIVLLIALLLTVAAATYCIVDALDAIRETIKERVPVLPFKR